MPRRLRLVYPLVMAGLIACHDSPAPPEVLPPPPKPPGYGADVYVPTYDGSNETVHPDVAMAPDWWGDPGQRYLAITPYPNGNQEKENPSLFQGRFDRWQVPPKAYNPIRSTTSGYLSDPDILFNPRTRELWVYYRKVTDSLNVIKLLRSRDGRTWPEPVEVVTGPNHTVVSPAVVRRSDGEWLMWAVNAGGGCSNPTTTVEVRRSTDGIVWSAPETVDMPAPPSGLTPWHIDVQWLPTLGEYWAVFNGKDAHGCGTKAAYLSTSVDGVHWKTRPDPLLVAGRMDMLKDIVYRSTFRYDAATDSVTLWYSGASLNRWNEFTWRTGVERVSRADLARRTTASLARAVVEIPASIPLEDPPR